MSEQLVPAMPLVHLSPEEFDGLLDYSCTLPTGTTVGKRWKCHRPYSERDLSRLGMTHFNWYMGEYTRLLPDRQIEIRWMRIVCPQRGAFAETQHVNRKRELPVHLL